MKLSTNSANTDQTASDEVLTLYYHKGCCWIRFGEYSRLLKGAKSSLCGLTFDTL